MPCETPKTGNSPLLAKYSMDQMAESISRLSVLVAKREADLSEVARLVAADSVLTSRLLEGDVPASGAIDEIEQQIFRLGVEPIIVLALSDPLSRAVQRTFLTMARITLTPMDPGKPGPSDVRRFTSSLSITGRSTGSVFLRMNEDLGRHLAAEILQMAPADVSQMDIVDVLGEVSNMVVGSFQSNLCDVGLPCKLSVPEVAPHAVFAPPKVPRGRHRNFCFSCNGMLLMVDLLVEFAE